MSNGKCKKNAKMVGYLEKRGKMTITGKWKKWWCVLEGHLLLYYRSQTDYTKLSPCCGSLNVALAGSIQPNIGCQIYITTYSQTVILRTRSKEKHQQWFHALASVLPPMNDRRLSIDNNFSSNFIQLHHRKSERRKKNKSLEARRKRNLTDIPTSARFVPSTEKLNDDTAEEIKLVDARVSTQIEETDLRKNIEISEIENGSMLDQLKKFYSRNKKNFAHRFATSTRVKSNENDFQIRKYASYHSITSAVIENNNSIRKKSLSCDCIVVESSFKESITSRKPRVNDINEELSYSDDTNFVINDQPEPDRVTEISEKSTTKKMPDRINKNTISRRSFNFFRKILTKGKPKECANKNINERIITRHSDGNITDSKTLVSLIRVEESTISEIIDNKIGTQNTTNTFATISEMNESVKIEECDSWTMIRNPEERPATVASQINDQQLFVPELPAKMKINSPRFSLRKGDISSIDSTTTIDKNVELDFLMLRLNNIVSMTHLPDLYEDSANEDPDYDIPRSHLSLIHQLETDNIPDEDADKESSQENRNEFDNFKYDRSLSMEMAPDSLEMPWLSNKSCDIDYFANDFHLCFEYNDEKGNDDLFLDSLNPVKNAP